MKHKVSFLSLLLIMLMMPKEAEAYDFSAVSPSGHTLYYTVSSECSCLTVYGGSSSYMYGDLIIPDSVSYYNCTAPVTKIANNAFKNCSGLTSVTIGSCVTSIGNYAFQNCSGLTSVIFNADSCISASTVSSPIFDGCSRLTSITFGNNVKRIPSSLCSGCINVELYALHPVQNHMGNSFCNQCYIRRSGAY